MQRSGSFQLLHCQTWGQGLLELLSLLLGCDDQRVQVPAAANLELHVVHGLLDLDGFGILPLGCEQKVLDFLNFPRHGDRRSALASAQGLELKRTGKAGCFLRYSGSSPHLGNG